MPQFSNAIAQFAEGLPTDATERLASLVQQWTLPAQSSIFDELPGTVVFVLSGSITSYLVLENSKVIELSHHGPGAVLGLRAVVDNAGAEVKSISRETCVLGVIPGNEFRSFLQQWPAAYCIVTKILASELQRAYFNRARYGKHAVSSCLPAVHIVRSNKQH